MCDERSPAPRPEPETPPQRKRTLSTMLQQHAWSGRIFIMVIDNNDSRTFRPVAVMVVEKAENNPSGSFRISP